MTKMTEFQCIARAFLQKMEIQDGRRIGYSIRIARLIFNNSIFFMYLNLIYMDKIG